MKRLMLSLAALAASFGLAATAEAATTTSSLSVSFTAVTSCSVTSTAINFGSGTGISDSVANGDVTVTCSQTVPYNIALDDGWYYSGAGSSGARHLSNGTAAPRRYSLFKDSAYTAEWGDSDFANTYPAGSSVSDTGTGAAQPHTVYGWFYAGAPMPAGSYYDVVTVTVHY